MGNFRFELGKFALYFSFPIGAFILFNTDKFRDYSLRQATESMSSNLNLENIKAFEENKIQHGVESLAETIAEIDGNYTSKKVKDFAKPGKSMWILTTISVADREAER